MHRDYLMAMIERLGELVRTVLNRNVPDERSQDQIDELANELTGLPATILWTLPEAEVYRLIEASSRMVPEKCYAVAELCRVQGLLTADSEERRAFFNRALFFYQSCAVELESELGETIAAHQADLMEIVGDAAVLRPDVRKHVMPEAKPRGRVSDAKQSWSWWSRLGVAAVVVLLGMIVLQPAPEFEITDTAWHRNGEEVVVNCLLHNRAESAKILTVQFLADFSSAGGFERSLSFAGRAERSFRVEPDSKLPVEVKVPIAGAGGGDVLLVATIIRVEG